MKSTEYDVNNIKEYLYVPPPYNSKDYLFGWMFIITLFGVLFSITDAFGSQALFPNLLIYITVPIFIDIYAIFIIIDVYRWQKAFVLFQGIACLAASILSFFFFIQIELLYLHENWIFIIIPAVIYVLIILYILKAQSNALKKGSYSKPKKTVYGVSGIGSVIGIIGVMLGNFINRVNGNIPSFVGAICSLILSYIFVLGIWNIHHYYVVKKFSKYVPVFEAPRKSKNQKHTRR